MDIKEYIKRLVRELLDEESTTAGVPGYSTPYAFSKKGQKTNAATKASESEGMKKVPVGKPSDSKVYDYKSFFGKKPTYKLYKENMNIQDIIKQELLNEATYKQFKKEVKFRTKAEQLHKAMREVKHKLSEIDRIVDYTQRMKQELSEGDGVQYWGRTEKAVAQISEMVSHLNNKINNLKQ
jgi:LPS O-antigen subunit length determinant protein (WzzB/FepE family)